MLSDAQIERYSRQIILPQLGGKGQEKFLESRLLVNGSGTRQAITLLYLAAAGVGTIGVMESQMQTEADLLSAFGAGQTGVVHQDSLPEGHGSDVWHVSEDTSDISHIVGTLTRLNPDCQIRIHPTHPTHPGVQTPESNGGQNRTPGVEQLVSEYDLVISEPDALLDTCFALQRPFVCSWGQVATQCLFVWNGDEGGPCLQCVPAELAKQGEHIVPHQAGQAAIDTLAELFFGAFQTTEALKCLIGLGTSAHGKVFACQFPDLRWSEHRVQKDPSCIQCGSCS